MDRTERIAGEMRRALSDILRNDLKDPRIPTVTSVTNIKLAKDLKYAKVYISIYAGEEEKKAALAALRIYTLTAILWAPHLALRIFCADRAKPSIFFRRNCLPEICRFSIAPTDFRKAYNSPYGSPTQSRNCRSTIWRSRWIRAMKSEWEIAKSFFTVQKDKFGSITIFRTLRSPR